MPNGDKLSGNPATMTPPADRTSVADLERLRSEYVARGVATAHPLFIERALGTEIWDVTGARYLDFTAGIGVLNVGHNHPRVLEAAQAQLGKLAHVAFQIAMYESYLRLAGQLCELTQGEGPRKAIFFNSGAEAVENAVKIARAYTKRQAILSFQGGFHGRTLLALSLTGTVEPYKEGFGPYAPEIYQVPYPYEYRGWSTERAMQGLKEVLASRVGPDQVAAVVIEPVLGEGGFVPAPHDFLRQLREFTREHGILLISDEVQAGFGRTGSFFAIEQSGVIPDLIAVAKSIAGGMPLSGVIGRAEIMDAPHPGGLGGTYGGNPVACAAGLAVLEVMRQERLVERALTIGSFLAERTASWPEIYPVVGDIRIRGAMAGVELVRNRDSKEPAGSEANQVAMLCRERGLLLLRAGPAHNVIRLLMPLNTPQEQIEEGIDILEWAISSLPKGESQRDLKR